MLQIQKVGRAGRGGGRPVKEKRETTYGVRVRRKSLRRGRQKKKYFSLQLVWEKGGTRKQDAGKGEKKP